ncbi:MAG: hypothetical protein QME96_19125, partial [Myxococcota bacterium]|nr:hypothetical protein [Myxococcota bacterium]
DWDLYFADANAADTKILCDVAGEQTAQRTGGALQCYRASLTGFATDAAGTYVGYDGVAADGGGAGTFVWGRMDAGWDAWMDLTLCATGEGDVALGANLGSAVAFRVGATDVLSLDTTTNLWALDLDATMDVDYTFGAAGGLLERHTLTNGAGSGAAAHTTAIFENVWGANRAAASVQR